MCRITKKEALGNNIWLFEVEAPRIAKKGLAGQFIIMMLHDYSERIPLTIADYDREKGTITIIFQAVGVSTQELAACEAGDIIMDVVGPLGLPSEIENYGTVVCVSGGVGIAPIFPIARALKEAGNRVISIIGARTADLLFWEDKMASVSDELMVATDDGSNGCKGLVTQVLKDVLEREKVERVWVIGPMTMMKFSALVTKPYGVKTIVSMNTIMVDGTGMCGACRVSVGNQTKFACVDGPEFDGHLVDWDLAIKRAAIFKDEEKRAQFRAHHGGGCQCH